MPQFGRDYRRAAAETRRLERGTDTPSRNGDALLGWPDDRKGRLALIRVSLSAVSFRHREGEWEPGCYRDAREAAALYRTHLAG